MPSYDPTENPITRLREEVGPLLEAATVPFFDDLSIQIFDVIDEENRAYPFVTFMLGPRDQSGAVDVYITGHVGAADDPGVHEVGAALEKVIPRCRYGPFAPTDLPAFGKAAARRGPCQHHRLRAIPKFPQCARLLMPHFLKPRRFPGPRRHLL